MVRQDKNNDIIESFDINTKMTNQVTLADPMILLTIIFLLILFLYISVIRVNKKIIQ
jgi:hypothetical protein